MPHHLNFLNVNVIKTIKIMKLNQLKIYQPKHIYYFINGGKSKRIL